MVIRAGQAEILRSVQRDENYQKRISDTTSDILFRLLGIRRWARIREHIPIASKLTYYGLTTMRNLQTLGEEYTGICYCNDNYTLPSKQIRLIMILLDCFGEKFIRALLLRLENYLMDNEAEESRVNVIRQITASIPAFLGVHKSVFYSEGNYFHLAKRITGLRYGLLRYWLRDRTTSTKFLLAGALSILKDIAICLSQWEQPIEHRNRETNDIEDNVVEKDKCTLCLNRRINTTSTPCGHLFCWNCIVPWLCEQPFCPLCRQAVQRSRVVLLRNF